METEPVITAYYISTVKNLMDYADSKLSRFYFFKNEYSELYEDKKEIISLFAVNGISNVWRWWYGCKPEERREYNYRIKELLAFTKKNIPVFGYRSWPGSMKLSALFMHSSNNLSFAVLYALNHIFRKLWPNKANKVLPEKVPSETLADISTK